MKGNDNQYWSWKGDCDWNGNIYSHRRYSYQHRLTNLPTNSSQAETRRIRRFVGKGYYSHLYPRLANQLPQLCRPDSSRVVQRCYLLRTTPRMVFVLTLVQNCCCIGCGCYPRRSSRSHHNLSCTRHSQNGSKKCHRTKSSQRRNSRINKCHLFR